MRAPDNLPTDINLWCHFAVNISLQGNRKRPDPPQADRAFLKEGKTAYISSYIAEIWKFILFVSPDMKLKPFRKRFGSV